MIDFWLCQKCGHCEEFEPGSTENGEVAVRPSVECGLFGDVLLMNSEPPDDCPYSLEHKLVTQDVEQSFADHMSGCRRQRESEF